MGEKRLTQIDSQARKNEDYILNQRKSKYHNLNYCAVVAFTNNLVTTQVLVFDSGRLP